MTTTVYISLGSNIDPEANLQQAVMLLRDYGDVVAWSRVYQTPPQGYLNQDDFLNMAVKLITNYRLEVFKAEVVSAIEVRLNRVRDPNNKNAPRTIDVDISLWGDSVQDYGDKPWHVPDREITQFAHVALPLADIAASVYHPEKGQTIGEIAQQFSADGFIVRTDLNFN